MDDITRQFIGALEVRRKLPLRAWVEQSITIPEGGHRGMLYSFARRPWTQLLVDAIERGGYTEIYLCSIPRAGKSLFTAGWFLHRVGEHGDPGQLVAPTEDLSADFYKDKIERILLTSPRLKALLPTGYQPSGTARRTITLRNGGVLRNVYNPASIRSYDSRVMLVTEAARFPETSVEADVITLALRRQDDWGGGYVMMEGTPTRPETRFGSLVAGGTDSRIHAPCPHCGAYFDAGRREHLKGWDVDDAAEIDPHVICPACGGRIEEAHREAMMRAGRLVHKNPDARALSLTVDWYHVSARSMRDVCEAEYRNKHTPSTPDYRDMMQNLYALPVSLEDERATEPRVAVTADALMHRRSGTKRGEAPPNAVVLCGGIDVQKDWLYHLLLAVDANGGVYPIQWDVETIVPYELQGKVEATPEAVLAALDRAHAALMAHNPAGGVWLDVGYKHASSGNPIVRTWAKRHPMVYAVMGRAAGNAVERESKLQAQVPAEMRAYLHPRRQPSGEVLWMLDVDALKTLLREKMAYPLGSSGGFYLPADIQRTDYLLRHLFAEKRQTQKTARGVELVRWVRDRGRNDLLDACVYAMAGALLRLAIMRLSGDVSLSTTEPPAAKEDAPPVATRMGAAGLPRPGAMPGRAPGALGAGFGGGMGGGFGGGPGGRGGYGGPGRRP